MFTGFDPPSSPDHGSDWRIAISCTNGYLFIWVKVDYNNLITDKCIENTLDL